MSALQLLAVPSALVMLIAILLLSTWMEAKFLSPRYLITQAVRVRNSPEHAERMVALHAEELLRKPSNRQRFSPRAHQPTP